MVCSVPALRRGLAFCGWFVLSSYALFAQLADQLPDTLSKKKVTGTYIMANGNSSKAIIKIRSNHTFSYVNKGPGFSGKKKSGQTNWEIKRDTLFFSIDSLRMTKFVMHNGSLHRIERDGTCSTIALMTKKDYKFYQRQCKAAGK